ncbi:MAG TPA: dihydrolipoamide acetyltransferase family protein [Rhizomicrobium sp.]|jgi:2-oxoisovalerate dehydrogenase E2 component (dihydrolipoyl transacylase)|nr:dihydrolipoamide acetyltransferase family protein [Rhizomicrobium sp.]
MGRYVFKLPDVGEGTAEAEIVAWHVKVGERIAEDQQLVDVMTDKATVEMTSPVTGVVVSLHGTPGEMATVGAPLVELDVEGAGNVSGGGAAEKPPHPSPLPPKGGRGSEAATSAQKPEETKTDAKQISLSPSSGGEGWGEGAAKPVQQPAFATRAAGTKPLASPAVRRRAEELGILLQFVPGTGPAGRIEHADLDNYIASGGRSQTQPGGYAPREGIEEIRVIGLRRKIAEKMQEAKRRIPHFAYVEEIDMTELEDLRAHLNSTRGSGRPKLTLLPFLMRGLVRLLPAYPQINVRFDDDAGVVHRHAAVHIGIATQTANGLIVPVVRHAEALDIWQSAAEIARIAALTRDGKATREDLTGSTITITSLGALGGVVTTPVINHPEVAIIGPNAIVERPMVRGGQIVVRKMMNLSSSFDHRVVDGYDAAEFIQKLKGLLEHPATLFME